VRDRIAKRDGMQPAALCSEALLIRISNQLPTGRAAFMAIDEATEALYDACGVSFVALIPATLDNESWTAERSGLPDRLRRTHMLLKEGYSLQEIAQRSALQPSTISGHIEELIKLGVEINVDRFVPTGILKSAREQLARIPNATLRELRALLGGAVDYPELRIAAAWIRAERASA
jgi:DNA-binding CsgD family transcriptional regulator